MKKLKSEYNLEILYDRYNETYLFAKVQYDFKGKAINWAPIKMEASTMYTLSELIEQCYFVYFSTTRVKRIQKSGSILK